MEPLLIFSRSELWKFIFVMFRENREASDMYNLQYEDVNGTASI